MLKSIIKEVKLNPSITSNELKNMAKHWYDIDITASCIRKRLIQKGYTKHSIFKKPRLTEKQKKMRLEWAKKYQVFTADDWKKVLFTDESKFELFSLDKRVFFKKKKL